MTYVCTCLLVLNDFYQHLVGCFLEGMRSFERGVGLVLILESNQNPYNPYNKRTCSRWNSTVKKGKNKVYNVYGSLKRLTYVRTGLCVLFTFIGRSRICGVNCWCKGQVIRHHRAVLPHETRVADTSVHIGALLLQRIEYTVNNGGRKYLHTQKSRFKLLYKCEIVIRVLLMWDNLFRTFCFTTVHVV